MAAILGQHRLATGEMPPFPTTPAVVPADHDPPLNLFQQDINCHQSQFLLDFSST